MSQLYDAVIIGGGHNGLVTAAYLAKGGLKVLVLERRAHLGGIASTDEPFPGFKFDSVMQGIGTLSPTVLRDLELSRHGLETVRANPTVFTPLPDGNQLLLWQETGRSVEAIEKFSKKDSERWPAFVGLVHRMAALLETVENATMPHMPQPTAGEILSLSGLGMQVQRMTGSDRPEFLRFIPMSVFELLNDWFESHALKGMLGAVGIKGLLQGPRATGTALNFLHQQVGAPAGSFHATTLVRGGLGKLAEALANAAKGFGAEIRTGVEVAAVIVQDGRATGVATASGEEIGARMIVSSADPKRTFFDLIGPLNFGPEFVKAVSNIKMRGCVAKVNLALNELPSFTALKGSDHLRGVISISPALDYLERAYDDAKYGRVSSQPYLECVIPTLTDPGRAPEGKHTMSVWMQFAPYHLRAGNWNVMTEQLGDLVVNTLAEYAPNLKSAILHRQVITPVDLEGDYGLTEGNVNHGEMMLEHLFFMRPVAGWAQYRTPLTGLYLCGSGTHPGGGITGRSGYNAAKEILIDARRSK